MERRKAIGGILSAAALLVTAGKLSSAETKSNDATKSKYTPWVGDLDRSKINWGPTLDSAKCIGCGMCMHCGAKVYDWVNKKPQVARYDKCMVGCRTCMNLCPTQAISFPPLADTKAYLEKSGIYDRIKIILKEQGKIPQEG
jgi:NAD-dependent dihydropyrimidine dehydrogenase PreA subunit